MIRLAALLLSLTLLAACEPIGPIPGRALSGEVSEPPADWQPLDEADVIQLETSGPYSVNIWGAVAGDHYYVASSAGEESRWAQRIARSPDVRARIDGRLFELRAVVVEDEDELEAVADAFNEKYDLDAEEDFPDVIIYRLEPRAP